MIQLSWSNKRLDLINGMSVPTKYYYLLIFIKITIHFITHGCWAENVYLVGLLTSQNMIWVDENIKVDRMTAITKCRSSVNFKFNTVCLFLYLLTKIPLQVFCSILSLIKVVGIDFIFLDFISNQLQKNHATLSITGIESRDWPIIYETGGKLCTNYLWTEWWSKACPSS